MPISLTGSRRSGAALDRLAHGADQEEQGERVSNDDHTPVTTDPHAQVPVHHEADPIADPGLPPRPA